MEKFTFKVADELCTIGLVMPNKIYVCRYYETTGVKEEKVVYYKHDPNCGVLQRIQRNGGITSPRTIIDYYNNFLKADCESRRKSKRLTNAYSLVCGAITMKTRKVRNSNLYC